VVQAGACGDGRARITVADSAHAASNLRRDAVWRPSFQKFFSPGSKLRKSPRELVSAVVRAVRARANVAETIDNDVEKPLCHADFSHSM
jgi:hypothetical protein